jgi:flagellar hook assembly protein FlgD
MLVRLIEERSLPAGHYVRTWDGTDDTGASVASGAYVFTIDAGDFHADQKGLLLK